MTKTKETKKIISEKEVGLNYDLIKYLKPFEEYRVEYIDLTIRFANILAKGPKYANRKIKEIEIIRNRLSELVIILEVSKETENIKKKGKDND